MEMGGRYIKEAAAANVGTHREGLRRILATQSNAGRGKRCAATIHHSVSTMRKLLPHAVRTRLPSATPRAPRFRQSPRARTAEPLPATVQTSLPATEQTSVVACVLRHNHRTLEQLLQPLGRAGPVVCLNAVRVQSVRCVLRAACCVLRAACCVECSVFSVLSVASSYCCSLSYRFYLLTLAFAFLALSMHLRCTYHIPPNRSSFSILFFCFPSLFCFPLHFPFSPISDLHRKDGQRCGVRVCARCTVHGVR